MKCSVCGSELEPGSIICKYCGNPVSETDMPLQSVSTDQPDADIVYCSKCGRVLDPFTHKCSYCESGKEEKRFCVKCGRELDPVTHKCPVCDVIKKYCTKCGRELDPVTHKCSVCDSEKEDQRYLDNDGKNDNTDRYYDEYEDEYDDYDDEEYEDKAENRRKTAANLNIPRVKGVKINMPGNKRKNSKKGKKKKNTALILTLSVAGMVALFALTFLVFFHLLGGTFSEEATESPSPTATVTASPSPSPSPSPTPSPKPTKAPTPAPAKKTQPPVSKPTEAPAVKPESTHGAPVTDGKYAYPSDSRIITREELEDMTRQEIKIVLNEIYARHGYTFNDDDLVEYFESKTWYTPTESDLDKVNRMLNDFEAENRDIIIEYQTEQGWR